MRVVFDHWQAGRRGRSLPSVPVPADAPDRQPRGGIPGAEGDAVGEAAIPRRWRAGQVAGPRRHAPVFLTGPGTSMTAQPATAGCRAKAAFSIPAEYTVSPPAIPSALRLFPYRGLGPILG